MGQPGEDGSPEYRQKELPDRNPGGPLQGFSPLKNTHQYYYDGDDQEYVDDPAHGVRRNKTK